MIIPSIHNLLAKLDSTFKKDSTDTNFYQILQMVAHEIDSARRELDFVRSDNYFYQVRDDQLFSNLGVLLKINKQPFFTKRQTLTQPVNIVIEEDFGTKPKCLTEHIVKVTATWSTELNCTTELDYTQSSPYFISNDTDPLTQLYNPVNESVLTTVKANSGTTHKITFTNFSFSSDLYFRVRFTNQVGETRQSNFIYIKLPDYPLLTPIITTDTPELMDVNGLTLQSPIPEDPFGYRQYRKILYGVLSSYLAGPTTKGIILGIQPFFDDPVQVVENFPAIPNLYTINAISAQYEKLVHTFQVNVLLQDPQKARNLGELNQQAQQVLEFIKPAHTLPAFQYVIPEHLFCPTDNPFGVKDTLDLEPMQGPCGEKVYINPVPVSLGAEAYYQDVYGYRLYCEYTLNYFGRYCYGNYYNYEFQNNLHGYYDVLDRNYFYINNGQRLTTCPFIRNRQIELLIESRNETAPTTIVISGDVDPGPNTFQAIPFSKNISVSLTSSNGPKIVTVTFNYPEQIKTNVRNLNDTRLGPGCHGSVVVDAVTYLLNTLPEDCCADNYIDSTTTTECDIAIEENNVLQQSFGFKLNEESAVLNGSKQLLPHIIDEVPQGLNLDHAIMTNVHTRTLNDTNIVLCPNVFDFAEVQMETSVCDTITNDFLILNQTYSSLCGPGARVLNRSMMFLPEFEFLSNSGFVTATEYRPDRAFILNGVEPYNNNQPFFNVSLMNDVDGPVMSAMRSFDVEPWNVHLKDESQCMSKEKPRSLACA